MRIGFLRILSIVFLVLKLTAVITWGWFWVFLPILLIPILILFLIGFSVAVAAILNFSENRAKRKAKKTHELLQDALKAKEEFYQEKKEASK